jgi:hypothetical protein
MDYSSDLDGYVAAQSQRGSKSRKLKEYDRYKYEALPKTRGVIRLLNLFPDENQDAGVLCGLITPKVAPGTDDRGAAQAGGPSSGKVKVESNLRTSATAIQYEAVSWCWGTPSKKAYIRIQRKGRSYAKYVSPDLVQCLKALRYPHRNRYLWIDMVCINQEKFVSLATGQYNTDGIQS